jgi:hypothetical protein
MSVHSTRFKGGIPLNTTGATETTLCSFATESDKTYLVVARVVAREIDGGNEAAGYVRIGTFHNDGGTLALVGSVTASHTAEITAGWDCTLDASGTNIRVRVTGAADTSVLWKGWLEVTENGADGNP